MGFGMILTDTELLEDLYLQEYVHEMHIYYQILVQPQSFIYNLATYLDLHVFM